MEPGAVDASFLPYISLPFPSPPFISLPFPSPSLPSPPLHLLPSLPLPFPSLPFPSPRPLRCAPDTRCGLALGMPHNRLAVTRGMARVAWQAFLRSRAIGAALRRAPIFATLTDVQISMLASGGEERRVPRYSVLYREGYASAAGHLPKSYILHPNPYILPTLCYTARDASCSAVPRRIRRKVTLRRLAPSSLCAPLLCAPLHDSYTPDELHTFPQPTSPCLRAPPVTLLQPRPR